MFKINIYDKKFLKLVSKINQSGTIKPKKLIIVVLSVSFLISIFFEGSINGIFVDGIKENTAAKSKNVYAEIVKSDTSVKLGSPFITLYLKVLEHKIVLIKGVRAVLISIAGNGTANDVEFKLNRSILLSVAKPNQLADVNGRGKMIADGQKGYSDVTFRERVYNNTVTNQSSGGIMFFTKSNGSLAFLDNSMAVFKQTDTNNHTSLVSAWRWS
jgi:hypothetical protein